MNAVSFFQSVGATLFSADPTLFALQMGAVGLSAIVIYTVLFVTRDVITRSSSLLFQLTSIVITAALPIAGFFLYVLIRPASTIHDRALRKDITELLVRVREMNAGPQTDTKQKKIEKYVKKSLQKSTQPSQEKKETPSTL